MPGPPPKPVEVKRRNGNPGRQKLPSKATVTAVPALTDERPAAPDHLGPAGTWLWDLLTAHATHWLSATDEALVLKVCEAEDRRADLLARIEADGMILYTDKGYAYAHPATGMLSTLEKQMTGWYSLLGLSPADRTRLAIGEVQVASTLDKLKAAKGG